MRGPFTTRHDPNLPARQQAVQRLADEFNAAGREWERTHPAKRRLTLRDLSFTELLRIDHNLAEARRAYAAVAPAQRRAAAQWEYDSAMAGDLFAEALEHAGQSGLSAERHDGGVLALAIDPLFAPALLTVGSLEYQCGRVAAAMGLFLALTSLPPTEPDLVEIIDKAGSFLLDRKDHRNALRLYRAATGTGPGTAVYWSGLGYCLGRLGRKEDAVTAARKAVEIERRNHIHLTDLGWALVEAGHYEEARAVLQAAVALAPPGYALARNNLKELEERAHRHGAARRVVPVNSEQAQAALFAKQSPRDVRKK